MQFPYSYFEDEVRDGFYVPSMMKRAWAAQLEILEDIDKVCRKFQIQYFAGWGTLLGAVRHEGFIPWDDDLDICMKRKDYNQFLAVAQKELPKGYRLVNYHHDDWEEMLSRVLSADHIRLDAAYQKKFHGFPYIAGIDIFPLDFLAPNAEEEELRDHLVELIVSVISLLKKENIPADEIEDGLCQIEELCKIKIDRKTAVKRQLYRLAEQIFSLYSEEEAEYLTMMPLWLKDGIFKLPKSYYQETVRIPFETTKIPVPAAYDAVLRVSYGDYMKQVHVWDSHDYPFYKSQEEELEKHGVKPHRYTFSNDGLRKEKHTMKKSVKKQAEEIVNLLKRAHGEVKKAYVSTDTATVLELLKECQAGAISLGNMIEKSEGEGFVTVGMLEQYCELIFQMYEKMIQGDIKIPDSLYARIQNQIRRIEDSIRDDIKVRMEAVFLPYKASMWDSLESVWRAAEADPGCDAYVIPIPYYEKNPDGSFRRMHYEGDQYPDDVPVTWYEDYDFSVRRPDMVFIHNPYDECNYVTSVHPFFYAKNLKQFTDKLVYIPYFVLDEIHPGDQRAVEGMGHFVTVPGVIHSDQVIVQSEGMRQAYIETLSKYAGEHTRRIWENKILGLGSPKVDKVLMTGKEDLIIPEEWMGMIQKEDGSRKKIILYNTTVSTLLQYEEKMLKKIQDVFEVFQQKQDEFVLLWRPHPLIEATICSMRPKLWEKYQAIVATYQKEHWGIYDDSADVDRAVLLADAYYGDASSVVQLSKNAGIPVMIQDVRY